MKQIHFILGVHNHQPMGNFSEVFAAATEQAYMPWMNILSSHPDISWNLHASGILWDWMKDNCPSYIQKADQLVKKGCLEILTGGYYEPILPILPYQDAVGQINKLTSYIKDEFSCTPQGLWLAERVWEPHMPQILAQSGVAYTVLDDEHFLHAGLQEQDLNGYFITENQGETLFVFPVNKTLRYLIPFASPEQAIEFLRTKAVEGGDAVIVLADDGEKFGLWPGTYDLVYKNNWLERFIALLHENSEWIITSTFSEIIRKFKPRSMVYLPCATYAEMSQWALPYAAGCSFNSIQKQLQDYHISENVAPFLHGGYWRNFFLRYPEANDMYHKMLSVSAKITDLERADGTGAQKKRIANARNFLWAGQCNCSYWHGVFGGVYLPHLRSAVYENLITAEEIASSAAGYSHEVKDFRATGHKELLIHGDEQNLYFSPASGGTLFEWDLKKLHFNAAHVMTRRPEIYHQFLMKENSALSDAVNNNTFAIMPVGKEPDLEKHIHYDWYRRVCFIDHFFHPATNRENITTCKYGEQGDFVLSDYTWKVSESEHGYLIVMSREGSVWVNDRHCPIVVQKRFLLRPGTGIEVLYCIRNVGADTIPLWFGCELNISFSEKTARDVFEGDNITMWERDDRWLGIRMHIESKQASGLWSFPVETVSSAEAGCERTYQGTAIILHWQLVLKPGESAELPLSFGIQERQKHYITGEEISRFINK